MIQHTLLLATEPFNAIAAGEKSIESRLYDEKRQQIQLGDSIQFINREAQEQTLDVKVVGLLRYETFHDMFMRNEPTKFGGECAQWLENQINEFYSVDQQQQYGVLGIEFERVD
ncbi:MAG TPA: ASCH domain-containing protein [Patescibacteria group bacterium]|jgi:ASC-1-like (ASCH) protein|nr:ASCH domain-containing protein [Patescibacteria group bacterium]